MKIRIAQSTNQEDKQEAFEEFEGTLKQYTDLKLREIQENKKIKIINSFVGERMFSIQLFHKDMGKVIDCEGIILGGKNNEN